MHFAPGTLVYHGSIPSQIGKDSFGGLHGVIGWLSSSPDLGTYGGLNIVVHPTAVTPIVEQTETNGQAGYYTLVRVTGTYNLYDTGLKREYRAYPESPTFSITVSVGANNVSGSIAANVLAIQSTADASLFGPNKYSVEPGDRNGPFWPTPSNGGSHWTVVPSGTGTGHADAGNGVCSRLESVLHEHEGTQCWIDQWPGGDAGNPGGQSQLFPTFNLAG